MTVNCPKPDPCELQTFKVEANSTYPPSSAKWDVQLPTQEHVIYQNLVYDLIGLLIMRVGVEMTKFEMDNDVDRLNREIHQIREVINKGILD
jgi:hypothetical protein